MELKLEPIVLGMNVLIKKNVMRLITIISIALLFICCSGSKSVTSNKDTIFIYFNKDEKHQYINAGTGDSTYLISKYQFILHDIKKYPQLNESITLSNKKFKDFDNMAQDNPVPVFFVNKKFIKNNDHIIIALEDMQKMGFNNTFKVFKKAKHIFLIDKAEIKDNKLTIKEVFLSYAGEE
jgi:hypothetical protein